MKTSPQRKEHQAIRQWLVDVVDTPTLARKLDVPVHSRMIFYSVAVLLLIVVMWASFFTLSDSVSSEGKIVAVGRNHVIQSLDGGILKALLVEEGEHIQPGQPLLYIDDTRHLSILKAHDAEQNNLPAEIVRLNTEIACVVIPQNTEQDIVLLENDLDFSSASSEIAQDIWQHQKGLMNSHLDILNNQLEIAKQQQKQKQQELLEGRHHKAVIHESLILLKEELSLKKPLESEGLVSRIDILSLERRLNELAGELAVAEESIPRLLASHAEASARIRDIALRFQQDTRHALVEARDKLRRMEEGRSGLADRVIRTTLTAPAAGQVKTIHFRTPGIVLPAGADLIEIVPAEDKLIVETRIAPQDIAGLAPGQTARVHLSAWRNILGAGLEGVVEDISADTVDDKQQPYYRARIALVPGYSETVPIPGMLATVAINKREITVMQYLLSSMHL